MIQSMTGYGRHKEVLSGRDIMCEIKAVNSRYLDLNIKISRMFAPFEDRVKQFVSDRLSRGKIDIYVFVDNLEGEKVSLSLNKEYLEGYLQALSEIRADYSVEGSVDLSTIAAKNEVFIVRKVEEDLEATWPDIESVLSNAFDQFVAMRQREGEKLKDDIMSNLLTLKEIADKIKIRAPIAVEESNQRIKERIADLLGDIEIEESRLLTECAIFADKTDINEELTRLESHFLQVEEVLSDDKPVGRKLDFLAQELNREINTIGSKANDTGIAKLVIDGKTAIERIREQIQNIE